MNIQLINMLWMTFNLMILNDYKNSYFIMMRCEGISLEVSNVEQNLMFGLYKMTYSVMGLHNLHTQKKKQ